MGYDFAAAFTRARQTNTREDGDAPGQVTHTEARTIMGEARDAGASAREIVDGFERTKEGKRLLDATVWRLVPPSPTAHGSGRAKHGDARMTCTIFGGQLEITVKHGDRTAKSALFEAAVALTFKADPTQVRAIIAEEPFATLQEQFVQGSDEKVVIPLPELVLASK